MEEAAEELAGGSQIQSVVLLESMGIGLGGEEGVVDSSHLVEEVVRSSEVCEELVVISKMEEL